VVLRAVHRHAEPEHPQFPVHVTCCNLQLRYREGFMNFELANWHLSEKGTGGKEITLWLKKISRRGENFLL
jgi:hypothetical protein